MAIELPRLPYDTGALAPHLSRRTLEFHYGKHHKGYVDRVNELVAGTSLDDASLEEIVKASHTKQPKLFGAAAQAWNHSFYWNCLTPEPGKPSAAVRKALARDVGSLADLQEQILSHGKDLLGSGWVWLSQTRRGKLRVQPMPNADTPMVFGETALLACDVWEHAYYLDYQQDRAQYLERFWSLINWEFVERNLDGEELAEPPAPEGLPLRPKPLDPPFPTAIF